MFYWKRGDNPQLSPHFRAKEFTCPCTLCLPQRLDPLLLEKLEKVRELYGKPIKINEGFRCARRQRMLREAKNPDGTPKYETAVGTSSHELGQAADITGEDLQALLAVIDQVFDNVGVAHSWSHVDVRPPKQPGNQKRRWYYK